MASRLSAVVRDPNSIGALFRKDYRSMEAFFRLSSLLHARTASKRAAVVGENGQCEHVIPEGEGFLRVGASQDEVLVGAVQTAREILAKHNLDALEQGAKKQFLIQIELDPNQEAAWPIFEFALSKQVVDPIAAYLRILPILTTAHIWYSPNKIFESGRSQEFHLDGADARQTKVFLFLDDIDEDSGPLTGLSADASRKIYDMLRQKGAMDRVNVKVPDPVMFELLKEIGSEPVAFTGKAGDMVFVDTCRCMHFGSRPSKGKSKPRKVVMLHYTRPYAPDLPLFGRLANAPALLCSKPEKERERLEYLFGVRR